MKQKRLLDGIGSPSPLSLRDYERLGGYEALKKAIQDISSVIPEITASGLRGRSGSGFPTGTKWALTAQCESNEKYVICNADEGEPGTGKDRLLLKEKPHLVIEGMIIAGLAVGAKIGYIYLRGEYAFLSSVLDNALAAAREAGYIGKNILGSGMDFDITVRHGAGAYLCGEETALIESIEGNRAEVRQKPPYPGTNGLWNRPTLLNNVETLANIPLILTMGAAEYRKTGTEKNPGTKLVTLSGCVQRPGVYEIPLGMPIQEIYETLGGGTPEGKRLFAVQTGGASGPFLLADKLNTPFDIESCRDAGVTLGVGDLMFIGDDADTVALSATLVHFFANESCGRCVPCRYGLPKLEELLNAAAQGEADQETLREIENTANYILLNARCALGTAAVTPVLSLLKSCRALFEQRLNQNTWEMGRVVWKE